MKFRKILQYAKIIFICGPRIIFYHFKYHVKFAKNPQKYPLELRYGIARKEIAYVLSKFNLDYQISGLDKFTKSSEKALLITNHLSFFDPLMIIANSEKPITFVAKKEVLKMPFVGKIAKSLEVFTIDRKNVLSQVNQIKEIVACLKDANRPNVIVYIEGTRNKLPENPCLDFHPGTLKIAQMAEVPIFVGATFGSFRALNLSTCLKKYPVFLNIFEKIDQKTIKDINTTELASSLKEKVDLEVDKIRFLDKNYILNMKLSKKVKELETKVDVRAKA